MNVKELFDSGRVIFSCVSGSHAYGTNIATSDTDMRGLFVYPDAEYLSVLNTPDPQIGDDKHNIVYYSIHRAFELLRKANPNQIELLWIPDDCVKLETPVMDKLLEHRAIFISKECFGTHAGYATNQIKKAKGSNKKVHNPQPEEMPSKEDFCRIILLKDLGHFWRCVMQGRIKDGYDIASEAHKLVEESRFPFRPNMLDMNTLDLSKHHVASLEHVPNAFRLYHYGNDAKGVFRGDDMLVCESIPKDEEWSHIVGLLLYDKHEYERAVKDWHSYWDWMNNRNDARWVDQEKGLLNYDQKNMAHCVRLLISAENILKNGEPLVRLSGDDLKYVMSIRMGEMDYDDIMLDVNSRMSDLAGMKDKSSIPDESDIVKVENLYTELRDIATWAMDKK